MSLIACSLGVNAGEIVLFEKSQAMDIHSSFCEVKSKRVDPPEFYVNEEGLLTYAGDGDFGLLYTKDIFKDFILDLKIKVPTGPFVYANSGIFFRFKDPTKLDDDSIPDHIKEMAMTRSAGFIAEWSGYEVQLLAGAIHGDPANKRNGAFYDMPVGKSEGQQELNEYKFNASETYDVRLKVVGQKFEVYMKWGNQQDYTLVSSLLNTNKERSYASGHVGIQSYYSNGTEVKALQFERISILSL